MVYANRMQYYNYLGEKRKKVFFILRVYINLYFWALLQLSVGHSEPEFLTFNLNNAQL